MRQPCNDIDTPKCLVSYSDRRLRTFISLLKFDEYRIIWEGYTQTFMQGTKNFT